MEVMKKIIRTLVIALVSLLSFSCVESNEPEVLPYKIVKLEITHYIWYKDWKKGFSITCHYDTLFSYKDFKTREDRDKFRYSFDFNPKIFDDRTYQSKDTTILEQKEINYELYNDFYINNK